MQQQKQFFAIRGYMKSGTNWIGALAQLHPAVRVAGEFHFEKMWKPVTSNPLFASTASASPGAEIRRYFQQMAEGVIETACIEAQRIPAKQGPGPRWFGDRSPGPIVTGFHPATHYVNVVRDPRDVLVSRAFHMFNRPNSFRGIFRHDQRLVGLLEAHQRDKSFFLANPEELLRSRRFNASTLQGWRAVVEENARAERIDSTIKVLTIRYEDVHADTNEAVRQLSLHLGLDPANATEIRGRAAAGFAKESPGGFFRKGAVGDWRNYFDTRIASLCDDIAGETMDSLGYDRDHLADETSCGTAI